jgi:hypothetical protein
MFIDFDCITLGESASEILTNGDVLESESQGIWRRLYLFVLETELNDSFTLLKLWPGDPCLQRSLCTFSSVVFTTSSSILFTYSTDTFIVRVTGRDGSTAFGSHTESPVSYGQGVEIEVQEGPVCKERCGR